MRISQLIAASVISVLTPIAILVYLFTKQVNVALGTNEAGNVLLIVLIMVDALGGALVPFLSTGWSDVTRYRRK
jgi:hypothetical protein